jgi:hypothetical protein
MQTELIIVSEYCHKCHIEPSFIEMLEEGGLINVHTEGGEHYLLLSELPNVERYSRMYYDLSIKALFIVNGGSDSFNQSLRFFRMFMPLFYNTIYVQISSR